MKESLITILIIFIFVFMSLEMRANILTIEFQHQKIAALELENYELKQACDFAEILRQILPPIAKEELSLRAEMLRQEKEMTQCQKSQK